MKRIRRIPLCILMITVLCGISIVGNSVVKSENKSKEKMRTAITKEEMKEWDAPDEEILEYYDLGKVLYCTSGNLYEYNGTADPEGECNLGKYLHCWMKRRGAICFSLFPILYTVLRLNTEVHLLTVNLIKNSIALNFIRIKRTVQKKCLLQEWEQTVNGC